LGGRHDTERSHEMPLPEPPPEGSSMLPAGTFANDVVMITGGGTGLGKAMAVEFARLGATVAVVSRKPEHREAGVAAIEAAGGRGLATSADIRDPAQVAHAFDAIEAEAGRASILINNAAG